MSKAGNRDPQDRRKHPRINIQDEYKKAKALKGAHLAIEGSKDELSIFDMSASGLACEASGAKKGDRFQAQIRLGDEDPQGLELEVMWASETIMGLRIEDCDANVRLSISDFLEDRIVGQHMIQVSPKYFSEHADFHSWFHGPNNTNIFLWRGKGEGSEFEKVMVAFDGQSMVFENGEFQAGGEGLAWSEQAIYSSDVLPVKENEELPVLLQKDSPLVQRSMEVLSQLREEQESIEKLLKRMEQV